MYLSHHISLKLSEYVKISLYYLKLNFLPLSKMLKTIYNKNKNLLNN